MVRKKKAGGPKLTVCRLGKTGKIDRHCQCQCVSAHGITWPRHMDPTTGRDSCEWRVSRATSELQNSLLSPSLPPMIFIQMYFQAEAGRYTVKLKMHLVHCESCDETPNNVEDSRCLRTLCSPDKRDALSRPSFRWSDLHQICS